MSSCFGDASLEITQHIADNHMDMCRFETSIDIEYLKVVAAIEHALKTKRHTPPQTTEARLSPAELQAYIKSLQFDQHNIRHDTMKSAHAKTCGWLPKSPEYVKWLDPDRLHHHNGFLWIIGKAGSGKSTMVKYLLSHMTSQTPKVAAISFFFNARGHEIEKSTLAMYRSLILQLFDHFPKLRSTMDALPPPNLSGAGEFQGEWHLETLRNIFQSALKDLGGRRLVCFVDALDECDEDEVRGMVSDFETICQDAIDTDTNLRICFSSRPYPHIHIYKCLELILERQEGHEQDLTTYLESVLKIGKSQRSEIIKREILQKANGVFLWLVLVVQILQKEYDRGRVHALQRRLKEIPPGLDEFFKDILTRDRRDTEHLVFCLQWVLFSKRPLKREELYFAILSGTEPEELRPWNKVDITTTDMDRFILDCSKGLVEPTRAKSPTLQFIHESVRDYLLKGNGLAHISPDLVVGFSGTSQDRLKTCCQNYLGLEIDELILSRENAEIASVVDVEQSDGEIGQDEDTVSLVIHLAATRKAFTDLQQQLMAMYPLLEYAIRYMFFHANAAGDEGVVQDVFVAQIDVAAWVVRHNAFEQYKIQRYSQSVSLLYIFAEQNLPASIRVELGRVPHMDIPGERYVYPTRAAIANRNKAAIRELLGLASQSVDDESISTHPHLHQESLGSILLSFFSNTEKRSCPSGTNPSCSGPSVVARTIWSGFYWLPAR